MRRFSEWIEERDLNEGILGIAKNLFVGKKREPGVPYDGDPLTIFWLYRQGGAKLLSSTSTGTLRIDKDGSVSIQGENGGATKMAKSVQEAGLTPNRNGGWKMERFLDQ